MASGGDTLLKGQYNYVYGFIIMMQINLRTVYMPMIPILH